MSLRKGGGCQEILVKSCPIECSALYKEISTGWWWWWRAAKEGVYEDVKWMWETLQRHEKQHLGLGTLLWAFHSKSGTCSDSPVVSSLLHLHNLHFYWYLAEQMLKCSTALCQEVGKEMSRLPARYIIYLRLPPCHTRQSHLSLCHNTKTFSHLSSLFARIFIIFSGTERGILIEI